MTWVGTGKARPHERMIQRRARTLYKSLVGPGFSPDSLIFSCTIGCATMHDRLVRKAR
jgi:hypothetical protein